MDTERIKRVAAMEALYDEARAAVDEFSAAFERYLDAQSAIRELEVYCYGAWTEDFEADERGEIPKDMKRGVLSEDALYDLFEENDHCFGFITLPSPEED